MILNDWTDFFHCSANSFLRDGSCSVIPWREDGIIMIRKRLMFSLLVRKLQLDMSQAYYRIPYGNSVQTAVDSECVTPGTWNLILPLWSLHFNLPLPHLSLCLLSQMRIQRKAGSVFVSSTASLPLHLTNPETSKNKHLSGQAQAYVIFLYKI